MNLDNQNNPKESISRYLTPLIFPVLIWVVHLLSLILNVDLTRMGLIPRIPIGLLGIITAPLIHANFSHLISNTIPLIVLGWIVFSFYRKVAFISFLLIYLLTGLLVWIFARQVYHIGSSGIVYGYVSFLFFSGIFRRDNTSITLALVITFLYGGLVWGILPGMKGIKKSNYECQRN